MTRAPRSPRSYPEKMEADRLSKATVALVRLIEKLRAPGGCPWDAKQTDSTLKMYLLEEAYEVLEAVEASNPSEVCSELGDLLFQILFLAQLAAERGEFDIVDVVEEIIRKMIRRHPHVFGTTEVAGADEVADNWAKIKMAEKEDAHHETSYLQSVPVNLPALLRAHRLSERASKIGFDWSHVNEIWEKVQEEWRELSEALRTDDHEQVAEEIGDLLFSLVNLARHWGFNAEALLRAANQKFLSRFKKMEDELHARGMSLADASLEQMDNIWEKTKDDQV